MGVVEASYITSHVMGDRGMLQMNRRETQAS